MKKKLFIKSLLVSILCFATTSCIDIFDGFLFDNEEDEDPQKYVDQYFTKEQQDIANTAKDISYLTEEEKKVIFFCNLARLDGRAFSDGLLDMRESTDIYEKSLVEMLDTTKDLPMLIPNEQLCKAAAYHAEDIGSKGIFQHNSSDGTKTFDRLKRYYKGNAMGENISGGYDKAIYIVCDLLIDQGIPMYGHRLNILSPKYTRIGTAIRKHTVYNYCCVQDFSDAAGDKK